MIGLIVDGDGDYAAFRARYSGSVRVLKTNGARGHTVPIDTLVFSVRKEVEILKAFRCNPIAIVTDLEGRNEPAEQFCMAANQLIESKEWLKGVLFFVSDKMIENWFLADIAHLSTKKKYLRPVKSQRRFESLHGKQELKKIFVKGFDYNEVRHSAELFSLVRGGVAAKFSPSFSVFRAGLGLD